MSRAPLVSVVVPHFESPERLARLLEALRHTTLPASEVEVVVADDGSATPPELPEGHPLELRMVRQEDRGFRAAAARNLGASAARGQVLALLDGDMLPEPGCLAALAEEVTGPVPILVTGRRRHHVVDGWTPQSVGTWLAGTGPAPAELEEPGWLADGLAATDHLRSADDSSFRYVISAVCAAPREHFLSLGGFDEGFVGYGGEDWELAQRAWLAGWELRHRPDAVAWHDGPEIAGRPEDLVAVKNAETAHLATRLTHPLVRGRGLMHAIPDLVVQADATGWTLGQGLVALESWLGSGDVGVWFGGTASAALLGALAADPRVHAGHPGQEVLGRCRWRVRTTVPVTVAGGWEEVARSVGAATASGDAVLVAHTRTLSRARREGREADAWRAVPLTHPGGDPADGDGEPPAPVVRRIAGDVMVERTRGVWA